MQQPGTKVGVVVAPEALRAELRDLAELVGERAVCERAGVSHDALARVVGGLGVRRGTLALVERALGRDAA